jgi:hypothetical protein
VNRDVVEVLFDEEDVLYGGVIVERNDDGSYEIQQEWGGEIETVAAKWVFKDGRKTVYKTEGLAVVDGHMIFKGNIIEARFLTFFQSPQLYQSGVAMNNGDVFKVDGKRFNFSIMPFDVNQGFLLSMVFIGFLAERSPRIAVLGCGGGGIPSVINSNYPHIQSTVVDISSGVLEVAKTYFGMMESPSLQTVQSDALVWLASKECISNSYDSIFIDVAAPDAKDGAPLEMPPSEFVSEAALRSVVRYSGFFKNGSCKLFTTLFLSFYIA